MLKYILIPFFLLFMITETATPGQLNTEILNLVDHFNIENIANADHALKPDISPNNLKIWLEQWEQKFNKYLWLSSIVYVGLILFLGTIIFVIIMRKDSDPIELSRIFFQKAGFIKIEETEHKTDKNDSKDKLIIKLIKLYAPQGQMNGMVICLWNHEQLSFMEQVAMDFAKQTGKKIKLYLVYTDNRPSTTDMQALRKKEFEVIPISLSRLQKGIIEDKAGEVLKQLEDPYLSRTDPYTESKPVNDPTWFYGRDDYMERIPKLLAQGQHVGIFGFRKVGKTSLFNVLKQRFTSIPTVFISCQGIDPKAEYYFEEIIRQLQIEVKTMGIKKIPRLKTCKNSENFRKQFIKIFELWKNKGNREPFFIMLDDIHSIFPDRNYNNAEIILNEYIHIFKVLRGLAESTRSVVTLVATYRPNVNRYNQLSEEIGENPMFKSFKEEYLGFFSIQESSKMIHEIGGWKDIKWENNAADRVYHYCGGHPLVTRYFASMACENGTLKYVDMQKVEQTADHVIKTFRKNEIGNYFQESIFTLMTDEEKQTLFMICAGGNQEIDESEIPKKLEHGLTSLEHFGIVHNDNGRLRFTSEFFKVWLKRKVI